MKRFISLLLSASFFILFYFATPSIAKESFKKMAIKAMEVTKNKAVGINNEGVEHFAEGHYASGGIYFKDALKQDPKLAEAHFNLGLVLHKTGKHSEAADHFRKASELAPNDSRIQGSKVLQKHLNTKNTTEIMPDKPTSHDSMMHEPEMKEHKH